MVSYEQINKKLVELSQKENFDHGSLAGSMLEQFLDQSRYEDDSGIIRYKTNFEGETTDLSQKLFENILYHINHRHFDLSTELANQLNQTTDPNGNTISAALADYFMGTNQGDILNSFNALTKIDHQTISDLAKGIIQKYDQNTVNQTIKEEIGENLEELKRGMKQINKKHNYIVPEDKFEKVVEGKNSTELINIYWQLINEARRK